MKDFTKTQKPRIGTQGRTGALKCNTCSQIVNAFGVEPGDPCAIPREDGEKCTGKYIKFDDKLADRMKRTTDGGA